MAASVVLNHKAGRWFAYPVQNHLADLPPAERDEKAKELAQKLSGKGTTAEDAKQAAAETTNADEPDAEPPPSVRLPPVEGESVPIDADVPTVLDANYDRDAGRLVKRARLDGVGWVPCNGLFLTFAVFVGGFLALALPALLRG